jgi:hypothetical protein
VARLAYVVELDPVGIAQLQAASALIEQILGNIQVIQIPDATEAEVADWEGEGGASEPEPNDERVPDPMFTPPPPPPPMNRQEDFGAGPPPGLA